MDADRKPASAYGRGHGAGPTCRALLVSAHFMRDRRWQWRYCRNDHHPDIGRDHLHLDDDAMLVGLGDSLAMSHITARLLAEPR